MIFRKFESQAIANKFDPYRVLHYYSFVSD